MSSSSPLLDKAKVVAALLAQVRAELDGMEAVAEAARDEATSSETKAEGKYDTRATEASYLARGQAWRVLALRKQVAWLSSEAPLRALSEPMVQVGSLVTVEGPRTDLLFVAPIGGGRVDVEGQTVLVISPSAPLGEAMVELEVDDTFEVDSPRGLLHYTITAIW
tara:strand:- start:381 stop:875 length:495 start_codon:yes stop_codon:yes gene_type:complete